MEEQPSFFATPIDAETQDHLAGAAKWARILGIAGIVLVALAVAALLHNAYVNRSDPSDIFGSREVAETAGGAVALFLFAVVPLAPMVFLLRFANSVNVALAANDQAELHKSFRLLKRFFRYLAIVCLLLLLAVGVSLLLRVAGILPSS